MKKLLKISFFIWTVNYNYHALAEDYCQTLIPEIESHFNGLKVIPGFLSEQIQIDKGAAGLSRFNVKDGVILMDAERMPFTKRKDIHPIQSLKGLNFQGVHIVAKTKRQIHRGIEIFDMKLMGDHLEAKTDAVTETENQKQKQKQKQEQEQVSEENITEAAKTLQMFGSFSPAMYFKNFHLQSAPFERDDLDIEGPFWILKHPDGDSNEWSHHSFLINSGIILPESPTLKLFFETDFNYSNQDSVFTHILNWFDYSFDGSRIDTCVYFLVR